RRAPAPSAPCRGATGIVQWRAGQPCWCERCRGPCSARVHGERPGRRRHVPVAGAVSPAAIVTGAARGMGAATVDALVADGWQVVAVDRCADDPALDYRLATKADLEDVALRHGDAVRPVVGDVRNLSDLQAAVDEALVHFGGLQAAVAVAGVIAGGPPLWEASDAQWDALFEVNVNGVRNLVTAAVPALLEAAAPRRGRVVAVASAAGLLGLRRLSAYSA